MTAFSAFNSSDRHGVHDTTGSMEIITKSNFLTLRKINLVRIFTVLQNFYDYWLEYGFEMKMK